MTRTGDHQNFSQKQHRTRYPRAAHAPHALPRADRVL
ncbi:hypothetical protein COLO4_28959 [Corchorus olitorius]|uniref:Uncharacterized protein n=1 Tax=Corchorus olitorius TaxID=93759 RepID=A0A1R3HH38_9ROSI|nr:hypothetical protein COLO4_28959 [Corchorus olitorius]